MRSIAPGESSSTLRDNSGQDVSARIVGVGLDALVKGRHVVYEPLSSAAPPVAFVPLVGPARIGAMLAFRF